MSGGGGGPTLDNQPDDELDLTPMIDMSFMLLAFFVVSSSMEAGSALQLPNAQSGDRLDVKRTAVVTVFNSSQDPEIYLSDGTKTNGPVTLAEVTSFARESSDQGKTTMVIKADRETPSGFVEEVARAAGEAEGIKEFFVGVRDNI
ncbi:MAG TPA: biopolymer transporter ExbD [Caulifigura sp.]|jgi:biopolymer transport protein ExbD|nr:biopolymer transporter ExbD [Caulifigura sp.]